MDKTFRILQLINLLSNRPYVTTKMIKEVCNVPARTAYRYLNTISEADIPVYFDRKVRAYRLSRDGIPRIDDLSLGDAVITAVALGLLCRSINEEYRDDVRKLITKVLVRLPFPIEQVLSAAESNLNTHGSNPDLSEIVSSVLIQAAIICRRRVRLTTGNGSSNTTKVEIENPSLRFKKNWNLVENQNLGERSSPLSAIKKVTIL